MSFKESIKQMAESQKMTIGFLTLNAETWAELFAEWAGENMSSSLYDWVAESGRCKAMIILFLDKLEADYNQAAEELESEGVAFYDHLVDKEAR